MKKLIALVCAALLVLGMTACAPEQNNDPKQTTDSVQNNDPNQTTDSVQNNEK